MRVSLSLTSGTEREHAKPIATEQQPMGQKRDEANTSNLPIDPLSCLRLVPLGYGLRWRFDKDKLASSEFEHSAENSIEEGIPIRSSAALTNHDRDTATYDDRRGSIGTVALPSDGGKPTLSALAGAQRLPPCARQFVLSAHSKLQRSQSSAQLQSNGGRPRLFVVALQSVHSLQCQFEEQHLVGWQ